MTNATSVLDIPAPAQPARQAAPEDEIQKVVEAVRGCLQVSLTGEAQNFRSWVAAAHRKSKDIQRLALALTATTCLLSLMVVLGSIWQAGRITHQAEARFQYFQQAAGTGADAFGELRKANWEPIGKPITQKGRTFIELKAAK